MMQNLIAENTPIAFILALVTIALLLWRVKISRFCSASWTSFGVASAIFWGILAALLVSFTWKNYYSLFAPRWHRLAAPLGAVVFYSTFALLFRWVSLRLPGNPILYFCLLGGLESVPEHAVAIYRFHILDIPILRGSTPASIFIFAFFEYMLFWGIALMLVFPIDTALKRFQIRIGRQKPF
jgi:hypothetical protein